MTDPGAMKRPPMTRSQRKIVWWGVAAAIFVILAIVGSVSKGSGSKHGDTGSAGDPASLLAKYDGASDISTYSAALDKWQAKCTETRVTDAGYVDASYRDEQKNGGSDRSRLEVMQNLTASVPASAAPTDCDGIAAAYLVLVEPG